MPICAQPTTPRLPCRPVRAGALTSRSTTAEPGCAVQANLCPAYLPGPVAPCDAMPRHETHAVTASPGLAMICRAVPLRPCLPRCAIYAAPRDNRPALPRHDQPRPEAPCADCLAMPSGAIRSMPIQPGPALRCPGEPSLNGRAPPCPAEPGLAARALPWRPRLATPHCALPRCALAAWPCRATPRRAMPSHGSRARPGHALTGLTSTAEPCRATPGQAEPRGNCRAQPCPAVLASPSPDGTAALCRATRAAQAKPCLPAQPCLPLP